MAVAGQVEPGFELDRRFIAERRVEALGVVDGFDESADLSGAVALTRRRSEQRSSTRGLRRSKALA
ncbi:MAG: hypothetical protein ABR970_13245 [Roseiarcus sp.]